MKIRWEVISGAQGEIHRADVEASHGEFYRILISRALHGTYDLTVHRVAGRHRDLVDAVLARGEVFASFEEAERHALALIEADAP